MDDFLIGPQSDEISPWWYNEDEFINDDEVSLSNDMDNVVEKNTSTDEVED